MILRFSLEDACFKSSCLRSNPFLNAKQPQEGLNAQVITCSTFALQRGWRTQSWNCLYTGMALMVTKSQVLTGARLALCLALLQLGGQELQLQHAVLQPDADCHILAMLQGFFFCLLTSVVTDRLASHSRLSHSPTSPHLLQLPSFFIFLPAWVRGPPAPWHSHHVHSFFFLTGLTLHTHFHRSTHLGLPPDSFFPP